jgi:hypothetical protein
MRAAGAQPQLDHQLRFGQDRKERVQARLKPQTRVTGLHAFLMSSACLSLILWRWMWESCVSMSMLLCPDSDVWCEQLEAVAYANFGRGIGFGFSNNDATQLAMRRVWIASLIETTAAFSIGLGRQARMMRKGSIRVSGFLDCPRPVILAKPTNVGFSVRIIHSVTLAKDRVEKGSRV